MKQQHNRKILHVLLMAGGSGERFKATLPNAHLDDALGANALQANAPSKVYWLWRGKSLLEHSYQTFIACGITASCIHVVCHPDDQEHTQKTSIPNKAFLLGGENRQESVFLGLEAIEKYQPQDVCIHDAARPGLTESFFQHIISMSGQDQCIVPVLPVTDTLARKTPLQQDFLSRENLYHVQTPQMFPFKKLLQAHRKMKDQACTDDAQMMHKSGHNMTFIDGALDNMKITSYQDFVFLMKTAPPFSVHGYDIHPFDTKGTLILGGIHFPGYYALAGHSDGDVLLHALCDALLSACGTDIGTLFPSRDARWADASSKIFLQEACKCLKTHNLSIIHADITMIGKIPPIKHHKTQLLQSLSQCLSLPKEKISFKARSANNVGETGAGKALAVSCLVTLQ